MAEQQTENASLLISPNIKLISSTVKLSDGNICPTVGLGTFLKSRATKFFRDTEKKQSAQQIEQDRKDDMKEEKEFRQAIITAVEYGYRHIDSAQAYRTEKIIASALQQLYTANTITRKDIFLTSKVARNMRTPQAIRDSIDQSLSDLNVKYIDLMSIHSPTTLNTEGTRGHDVIQCYKILNEYRKAGKIRSIGVSNFGLKHLQILVKVCNELGLPLPVCNQIECHPFLQETDLIQYCANKGILIASYSPIAQAREAVKGNKTLKEIATKYNVTWSQVMLRWQIQKGFVLLPKSVTTERILSNGNIFDFNISKEDMNRLDTLSKENIRVCLNVLNTVWDDYGSEEKENVKDLLAQGMSHRKKEKELYTTGIKKNKGVSDALQGTADNLEREQRKDKLKKGMRSRSDSNKLADMNILQQASLSHKLQATAKSLDTQQKKDKLKQWLEVDEVGEDELYAKGIKKEGLRKVSDALQGTADNLEREQRKDKLNNKMKERSKETELKNRGILPKELYDVELEEETQNIIDSLEDHELNALKRTLESDIRAHNEAYDPQIYVYLNSVIGDGMSDDKTAPMSPNTRKTMEDIFSEHDSKNRKRDSKIEMETVQKALQSSFASHNNNIATYNSDDLDKQTKTKILQTNLEKRPERQQLKEQNIIKSANNSFEKEQQKNKLKQGLDNRSTAKDLKDKGIIYSQNIAPSLQPKANELEQQLIKLRQLSTDTVQKNKDLEREKLKLQEIIKKQSKLIQDFNASEMDLKQESGSNEMDTEIKQCLHILSTMNSSMTAFEVSYNKMTVSDIGNDSIDELINSNSIFNNKLEKYVQIINAINICSSKFKKEINSIKAFIQSEYIPNTKKYQEWDLEQLLLWIKFLDNGRFAKYLSVLKNGFEESDIEAIDLPDLSISDLSVTPFRLKIFKDKRYLIEQFQGLRSEEENESVPTLAGKDTNEVVQSILTYENEQKTIEDKMSELSSVNEQVRAVHSEYNILSQYQEKQLYGQYYMIRRDIIDSLEDASFDDGSWGPIVVRLCWHASGTFDSRDNSGGVDGATMRFKPEMTDPENAGLHLARNKLQKIKEKYDAQISYADLWVFASYIAIESMGGPYIAFKGGRTDHKTNKLCPANGRLPSAEGDAKHIRQVFGRMGFNDQEIVALIGGGHVLGRCHKDRSGYDGPWVDNPIQFSNEFFAELFENEWEEKTIEETGKVQFKDNSDELMMLPTDMEMIKDEKFKKWSEIYYKDKDRFMNDFANAFKRLTELGCDFLDSDVCAEEEDGDVIVLAKKQDKIEEQYVD